MDTQFVCRVCGEPRYEREFYTSLVNNKVYRRKICKACDKESRGTRPRSRSQGTLEALSRGEKRRRKDPKFSAKYIVRDSRSSDKKFSRDNDLDRVWVEEQVAEGCSYCGETQLRMTLDRVDNAKGHTRDNVRPACIRCNYLRRDLPFEAWLILTEAVRKAREQGAFGDWEGSPKRK